MTRMLGIVAVLVCMVAAMCPRTANAWGAEGHRITGYIAYELLDSLSRERIRVRLGTDDLAQLATYVDERKQQLKKSLPGSDRWHYDNRPVCEAEVQYRDYCEDGACASAQINRHFRVLLEDSTTKAEALLAARFMIHIIGDVHQPLHAADNGDIGGNVIMAKLQGSSQERNLHSLWDTTFVRQLSKGAVSEQAYAKALVEQFRHEIPKWQSGSVRRWMRESAALAKDDAYGGLVGFACGQDSPDSVGELNAAYVARAQAIIPEQLTRAGARIAFYLERALAED